MKKKRLIFVIFHDPAVMKIDEIFLNFLWHPVISNFWWHTVIYKFPVAHGHLKFFVAHGHLKFSVAHGHLQIPCGTRSFTNSLWHAVIYKFPVARGHFKFPEAQGHSEHNSFDTSSFNPKGNHRLPWAPNFCKLSQYEKTSFVEKSIKTRQPAMDIQEK